MIVSGTARWALLRETPDAPDLREIAAHMAPVDLILVEGFKAYDIPKIEVFRTVVGKPPLWHGLRGIVAVATDEPGLQAPHPLLPLDDPATIAAWIAKFVADHPAVE
jgi:molybdopterin-guanine dinucleotide biosynthesis protein B